MLEQADQPARAIDRRILKEDYRNYDLVARYWRGEYTGRLWKNKQIVDDFVGDSLEAVIHRMHEAVDREIEQSSQRWQKKRPSCNDLAEAFKRIQPKLTTMQLAMLQAHVEAEKHTLPLLELQAASGFASSTEAMLEYARIGSRLSDELGYIPVTGNNIDPSLAILLKVDGTRQHSIDGKWVMNRSIAKALDGFFQAEEKKADTTYGYRFTEDVFGGEEYPSF